MPYYFGEDSPGWDEVMEKQENGELARSPRDMFAYVEPWEAKTTVLQFPKTPPPPIHDARSHSKPAAKPASKPGLLARIFRSKPPVREMPTPKPEPKIEIGSEEWLENYHAEQKNKSDEALMRVAVTAAALRNAGVRRLFIRYDGGNDEGFTHFEALEMSDGRRLAKEASEARKAIAAATKIVYGDAADIRGFEEYGYLEILDDAAVAFLGPGFGTGPYEMFGAITVDCEACTLTDEKDPSRAFPPDNEEA